MKLITGSKLKLRVHVKTVEWLSVKICPKRTHVVVRELRSWWKNQLLYVYIFLFLASLPNKLVYKEQHRSWCTLGFIRSIALMPQMCSTLSTSQWITLLMKIVEGHESFTAASLQRQVMCAFPNYFNRQ